MGVKFQREERVDRRKSRKRHVLRAGRERERESALLPISFQLHAYAFYFEENAFRLRARRRFSADRHAPFTRVRVLLKKLLNYISVFIDLSQTKVKLFLFYYYSF